LGKIDGKCQGQDKVKVTSGTITEITPNPLCAIVLKIKICQFFRELIANMTITP